MRIQERSMVINTIKALCVSWNRILPRRWPRSPPTGARCKRRIVGGLRVVYGCGQGGGVVAQVGRERRRSLGGWQTAVAWKQGQEDEGVDLVSSRGRRLGMKSRAETWWNGGKGGEIMQTLTEFMPPLQRTTARKN